jgi:ABC-2 type transport system permease protein
LSVAVSQYLALSKRSVLTTIRQPTSIIPSLIFPLFFMALSSAAFSRTTQIPGFPEVDSFLQFVISTTILQGTLFGSVAAGAAMATDIEHGFFDRLVSSPVSRTSILVGRLAGAATMSAFQAVLYFAITLAFGLDIEGGLIVIPAVALVAALVSAGTGSFAVSLGLRTGSTEAVQGSFPLLFVFLFLSSAFFPRNLMTGWFKTVATINPLSHLIESMRSLVIDSFQIDRYLQALGIAGALCVVGLFVAARTLRWRLGQGGS